MSRRFRAGHTDGNQAAIVAALRSVGCSVVDLSATGGGVPDLLVGRVGVTFLLEVKDAETCDRCGHAKGAHGLRVTECWIPGCTCTRFRAKPPSKRALRKSQRTFAATWRGTTPVVVSTVQEALRAVGVE